MGMHKKMMAAGGNMKKKMMAAGGSMMKKGYAAGGAMMKKKMMAAGGSTSSYDPADRKYPGAGKKKKSSKKPVVTKAMMTKAGVTNLRDFYNKMEVNAAGTGYKKRSKALTRKGSSSKSRKTVMGSSKNVSVGTGKGTTTMKSSKNKKAGPLGFKTLREKFAKRGGFRFGS